MKLVTLTQETKKDLLNHLLKRSPNNYGAFEERVQAIIHDLDPRLSIHDFRMVSGQHHANVIFDMVIPADLESRTAELRRTIEDRLQDGKKTYHLVVTFDTAAFNEMTTEAEAPVSRKAQP